MHAHIDKNDSVLLDLLTEYLTEYLSNPWRSNFVHGIKFSKMFQPIKLQIAQWSS